MTLLPAHTGPDDLPPDYALLTTDIVGYSKVPETAMPAMRNALDEALAEAFEESGLASEWESHNLGRDTGDGWIRVVPAAKLPRLVDPCISLFEEALHRYDCGRHAAAPVLRTRLSVHLGPLSPDYRGNAINDVCRLVESDAVRSAAAVAAEHDSFTAAIISDEVHRRVVLAERTLGLSPRDFLEVSANVREKQFSRSAWVHVPRLAPALIRPAVEASRPATGTSAAGQPAAAPAIQITGNVGTAAETIQCMNVGGISFA
ncbi:hypothetical protein [Streptomyces sp. FH025]|uniref:hypothetical protein n=1 Tax=Streptomyces sp. FH025 TaxID=2815937 RepID=UPI001A9FD91C|nr:hypothetical protein [Streptomyces sp. FH025]MBO1413133.1 hypothetical protein [Streptomyces sp. FH025]